MKIARFLAKGAQGCVMSSGAETSEAGGRKIIRCLDSAAVQPRSGLFTPPFQLPGFYPGLFKFNHFVVSGSFPVSAAKGSVFPRHDTTTFARGLL